MVGLTKSNSEVDWIFKNNLFKYFDLIERQYDITLFQLFYLKRYINTKKQNIVWIEYIFKIGIEKYIYIYIYSHTCISKYLKNDQRNSSCRKGV